MEKVVIKVAVEFCLAIEEIPFLFGEIYNTLEAKGLESQFIRNLSAPIIAGEF